MNIFDQYLDNLKKILLDLSKNGELILPDKLDGINAEIPPSKFNSDISTNVAMFLSKVNNKSPKDLAEKSDVIITCLPSTKSCSRVMTASLDILSCWVL